jgi:predicted metal-dependent hydrolase
MLHKECARTLILERVAYWCGLIPVTPSRIAVKDQRSRWGSCSTKGNLNFNYRLAFLPLELVDYVIVHELTHLLEFNHSSRFWEKVGAIIPDYKARMKTIHTYSLTLISHDALTALPSPLLTPARENASVQV